MPNKKKIKKLVNKFRKKFNQAETNVETYRSKWDEFDKYIREVFEVLKEEHQREEYYSTLFIQDGDFVLRNMTSKNKSYIAIEFGLKPLDISEREYNPQTGMLKVSQEAESGGSLFFSQGEKSQVLVYLFPAKDVKDKENNVVSLMLGTYSDPSKIKEKHLLKHIKQFFWYSLITSYLSDISTIDRYKTYYYKFRSKTLELDWGIILPALILVVSIIHLILFVIYVVLN
jgi:hypothetical protein